MNNSFSVPAIWQNVSAHCMTKLSEFKGSRAKCECCCTCFHPGVLANTWIWLHYVFHYLQLTPGCYLLHGDVLHKFMLSFVTYVFGLMTLQKKMVICMGGFHQHTHNNKIIHIPCEFEVFCVFLKNESPKFYYSTFVEYI